MSDRAKLKLTRRSILHGLGATVCLPWLETLAAASDSAGRLPGAAGSRVRAAYLYIPNGVADGGWDAAKVDDEGRLLALNKWMAPLEPYRSDLLLPRNVWTPRGNGHSAGTATWLTGHHYDGKRIDAGGASVDQLAASKIGGSTLLPSLELSLRGEGFFSKSLSRNTLSWLSGRQPASRETVPRVVFDRMFRGGGRTETERSVLDLVLGPAGRLRREVSDADGRKVDEYLDAVRSVEKRLEFAEKKSKAVSDDRALTDTLTRPAPGIPTDHQEYIRLMLDLVVLAFWSDATRVVTFMLDHGQSNRYFNFVPGVKGTWHALSHYRDFSGKTEDDDGITSWGSLEEKRDMYNEVTRWHNAQVAYLIGRLKGVPEGEGTLLDSSMILYGSSLSDGHEHAAKNLPLLLAGGGGGTIRGGRQIRFEKPRSMSDLHLSMLHRLGASVDEFGGSDTPMTEIDV